MSQHNDISTIIGRKGSGKTTYLTVLSKEATRKNSRLILIPNNRNKMVSKTIGDYKKNIENNTFPKETTENQFNS